jgi:hypothetical protein
MSSTTVTLEAPPGKRGSAKTRIFSVHLLGFLTADSLWTPVGTARPNGRSGSPSSVQRVRRGPSPPTYATAVGPAPAATFWSSR